MSSGGRYRREAVQMAKQFGYELVGQTELNRRHKMGHLVFVNQYGHKVAAPSTPRVSEYALVQLNQRLRKERTMGEDLREQFVTWLLDKYDVEDARERVQISLTQEAAEFVDERKLRDKPGSITRDLSLGTVDPRIRRVVSGRMPLYDLRRSANGSTPPVERVERLAIKVCGATHPSHPEVTCVLEPNHKKKGVEAHAGGEEDLHWYDPMPIRQSEQVAEPWDLTAETPAEPAAVAPEPASRPVDVNLVAMQGQMQALFDKAARTDEAEAKAALALEELTKIQTQVSAVESLMVNLSVALNQAVQTLS